MDSLAILQRGYFYPTAASTHGLKSDCPYCLARHVAALVPDTFGTLMNSKDAGRRVKFFKSDPKLEDCDRFFWVDEDNIECRLIRDHWLFLPDNLITAPAFLAPFSLQYGFILDELATWFCNRGLVGPGFHWNAGDVIELVRVCWELRIPVKPHELSKILIAHGAPMSVQGEIERLFSFGTDTLISSRGRHALKKLRKTETAQETLLSIWRKVDW